MGMGRLCSAESTGGSAGRAEAPKKNIFRGGFGWGAASPSQLSPDKAPKLAKNIEQILE